LYNQIDVDGDGSIMWTEFVLAAPGLLRGICAESLSEDKTLDWIELPGDASNTFWYNKRTSATMQFKPEIIQEKEAREGPDVKEYLKKQFLRADKDNSGDLVVSEFWALLRGMLMGLSDQEIATLYARMDEDRDGDVEWNEFVLSAPTMLKEIYESRELNSASFAQVKQIMHTTN
jgi:hypothetical protein